MKKTLLLIASAALLLVGCAKEQGVKQSDGEMVTTTFAVSMDNGVTTKAVADEDGAAASVNRCIMEIYYGDEFYERKETKVENLKATFTTQVVSNRTYTVAFWADCGGENYADKYYTTTSLKEITLKDGAYAGNDDARDAFFHFGTYTVAQGGSSFGTDGEIKLTRPFAQVNVITTDWDKAASVTGLAPDKVNVTLKNALVAFNAVTGVASGSQTLTYTADVYAPEAQGAVKTLSMDYLFASKDKAVIDIDWKALHGNDAKVTHSFAAVPYQRNYRTNIKGTLLTSTGNWTVTVDPSWASGADGENDYNVDFYSAPSVSKAQEYLGHNDEQASKTVDLTKATITKDDIVTDEEGNKKIQFILKKESPVEQVNFSLPKIPAEVLAEGCTGWKITFEPEYPTKNVGVSAPEGTKVKIEAPTSHVTVTGTSYAEIVGTTGDNTLVIPQGVSVAQLTIAKGGLEIHGTVAAASVTGTKETVFVRECENLIPSVYDVLKDYIAPNYVGTQNTDNTWNIALENFWPNFAAKSFSAIDESAKTITIKTPEELALLAKNVNNKVSYNGYTITIDGNLDMSAHYWIPINAYQGGTGYLSGVSIVGASNATISNLKIEKAVYKGNYDYYAGFIAQTAGTVTFKDLTFTGAISVDNGSGVANVLGLSYGNVLFDNIKVINSTVTAETKAGALLGFTGGDGYTITVKDCSVENVTVSAVYSYAIFVGLINTNDHVVFEGNCSATNSHAVIDETIAQVKYPERKEIKGYTYGVGGTNLWVVGVQDAWAECRTNPTPTKVIDGVEYSIKGDIFYHADGVVVDVCAPDPVAQIGDAKYATLAEAFTAVQEGQTIEIIQAGSYAIPSPINNITVKGADDLVTVADEWGTHPTVVFDASQSSGQLSKLDGVIFSNIKFLFSGNKYTGFQHQGATVTFNKCDFEGLYNGYGNMIYNNCYFKQSNSEYVMWTYGSRYLEFNNCKFNVVGKALNVYQEKDPGYDHIIKINNCNFVSSTANKPALAIKNNGNGGSGTSPIFYDITITNSTFEGFGQSDGDLIGFPTDAPYVNAYGYNGATQPLKVTVDSEVRVNIPKN